MAKRAKPAPKAEHRSPKRPEPQSTSPRAARAKDPLVTSAAPTSAVPAPAADALLAFERAIRVLQRHDYREAAEGLRVLISRFPGERALLDRARVYLEHCERELRRKPPAPKTIEERLTAATAALNLGDDRRAQALAESVLAEEPRQDLALYLLAAIAARRGAVDAALVYLGQAIAIGPEVRAQARLDNDFESLRGNERYRQLIDPSGSAASAAGRRGRRGRAER